MALKLTADSFLQVLRQSGLVEKDQLQKLLQKFAEQGIDVNKSQAIADALVTADVITRWQADKLMSGKHKGFFLGKYKLLDLLGKGGMSSVYLAEHVLMKRRCAIKVLPAKRVNDTSYLARFHREAQAVAAVDHLNIVRAYDVDCAQDRDTQIHFLVMEHVNGRSLQEIVVCDGPLDFSDAVEFVRQAADGLDHAHRAGLVHRDIKPGNLLVDVNGVVKILDMGLARFFDDREENPLTVAHDEKVLGTADYLAPEQALDSHSVDQRADIYSLGCSLYFLLTGNPPFTEGTLAQRLMWHQIKSFPPLTEARLDCPASLMALLNKMVEKKPEDRFQTAAEVAEACRNWLNENATEEWRQRHVIPVRGTGSGTRLPLPPRDLRSDSSALAGSVIDSALQRGSTVFPERTAGTAADDSSATKISQNRTGSSKVRAPVEITAAPAVAPVAQVTPPEMARTVVPVAAPMAAPVVAPIAMPVAQPMVAPPVAKPVLPVAAPVAMPVAPVAQPISVPATPVAPVAQPVVAPVAVASAVSFPPPDEVADVSGPKFPFSHEAPTANEPVVPETAENDLLSMFAESSESVAESQPAMAPVAADSEPTVAEWSPPVLSEAEAEVESEPQDFESLTSDEPFTKSSVRPPKPASAGVGKSPKLFALIAGVLVLVGGTAFWLTRGSSGQGESKTAQKTKKAAGSSANGTAKKDKTHDIAIKVGRGGDFDSIGRALYSMIENRSEHEQEANGKPLRFIVSVSGGQPFEESFVIDETFPGELVLKSESDRKVKLVPSGTDPAVTIKGARHVTIENFFIDLFPPKDRGILISGSVPGCRIKNCVISGAGRTGIELANAQGGERTDAISIEGVTFQNASPEAVAILLAKGDGKTGSEHVLIQRCRFISSMAAAVFVESSVNSLTIRNCAFSRTTNGVRFSGANVLKNVAIERCSFFEATNAAILFDDMPAGGSEELRWRDCLFAGVKKTELMIAKNYDAQKFDGLVSVEKPVANNWSDRAGAKLGAGERDPLGEGGQRVERIEFASVDLRSDLYLVAKPSSPYKTAGVSK